MRKLFICLFILFATLHSYAQFSISGYVDTREKSKTIYLSLLRFDEETTIYGDQILFSTKTDSLGFFEFHGRLLSNENKLYRIHTNKEETSLGLQIYSDREKANYLNFVFSNTDTLYFPKGSSAWFGVFISTNPADLEWRKLLKYEEDLLGKYKASKNDETQQVKMRFINEIKSFCDHSISYPLIRLLAYSRLKSDETLLIEDFNKDPDFYTQTLDQLRETYDGISYFTQFQSEISKMSNAQLSVDYEFHKRLNYWLAGGLIFLTLTLIVVVRRLSVVNLQVTSNQMQLLTSQEEKVANLICEGRSNKEIASDLFISSSTVKSHIRNLYSKLEVHDRTQLIGKLKNQP